MTTTTANNEILLRYAPEDEDGLAAGDVQNVRLIVTDAMNPLQQLATLTPSESAGVYSVSTIDIAAEVGPGLYFRWWQLDISGDEGPRDEDKDVLWIKPSPA